MLYVNMNDIDTATGKPYKEYEAYVINIYPEANLCYSWLKENLNSSPSWSKYDLGYRVLKYKHPGGDIKASESPTLGKSRRQQATAWKSAYLELKKWEKQNAE